MVPSRELQDEGSHASVPEGVVILGMHRSGTSLITRLVSLLGLAVCRHDDLLVGRALNPRGHWESKSLLHFNDRLLEELGARWFCPPLLGGDVLVRMLERHAEEALALLERAHPVKPWVWKDPRTCVLMPFWTSVLEQRAAYVLVVRHPLEVSDSLARRSGCTPLLSIALWERYTRQAMLGAAGRPLLVCTYDGVLADPLAWSERLRSLLGELGLPTRPLDREAVDAFVMDELRHSDRPWAEVQPGTLFSEEQAQLSRAASEATAQSSYEPPLLGPESPRTESVLEEVRRRIRPRGLRALRRQRPRELSSLPARLYTSPSAHGGSGAPPGPPVSVILASGDAETVAHALAALAPTLPAGSEVLVPGTEGERPPEGEGDGRVSLRVLATGATDGTGAGGRAASTGDTGATGAGSGVDGSGGWGGSGGEAAALALGVQQARGRMIVLTTGAVQRWGPWYAAVERALAVPEVGGVGPVVRSEGEVSGRYAGQVFADADLRIRPLAGGPSEGLVPTGLLPDVHCAYSRALLAAAGGIDGGFDSACGAIAELSVRLWRMGFRCRIAAEAEVWVGGEAGCPLAGDGDGCGGLYDRLRIAALHLGEEGLQAFRDRASRLACYERAAERLAESDLDHRRATIAVLCPFPAERYFESFPLEPVVL